MTIILFHTCFGEDINNRLEKTLPGQVGVERFLQNITSPRLLFGYGFADSFFGPVCLLA